VHRIETFRYQPFRERLRLSENLVDYALWTLDPGNSPLDRRWGWKPAHSGMSRPMIWIFPGLKQLLQFIAVGPKHTASIAIVMTNELRDLFWLKHETEILCHPVPLQPRRPHDLAGRRLQAVVRPTRSVSSCPHAIAPLRE
jgi:hypothetical protein